MPHTEHLRKKFHLHLLTTSLRGCSTLFLFFLHSTTKREKALQIKYRIYLSIFNRWHFLSFDGGVKEKEKEGETTSQTLTDQGNAA